MEKDIHNTQGRAKYKTNTQMDKKYKGITDHKKEASKRHRRVDFKQMNIGITTATEAVLLTQKKFLLYYVNN